MTRRRNGAVFVCAPFLLQGEEQRCSAPITQDDPMTPLRWQSATLACVATTPWLFPNSVSPRRPAGPSSAATAAARRRWRRPCAASWSCVPERYRVESGRATLVRVAATAGGAGLAAAQYRHAGEEEEAGYRVSTPDAGGRGEEHEARALLAVLALNPCGAPYRYLSSGGGASCCWPGPAGRPELLVLDEPSMVWIRGPGLL